MPMIGIRMLRGRTPEQKRRLLQAVTDAARQSLGTPLESIRVWIQEMSPDEYMVAGRLRSDTETAQDRD